AAQPAWPPTQYQPAPTRSPQQPTQAPAGPPIPAWGLAPPGIAPANPTAVAQPPEPRTPTRMRRLGSAVLDLAVTMGLMGGFVGCWALAVSGVLHHDSMRTRLGAAASVLFTPLAIHRLTGRAGRPRLLLIGSVAASATALHFLAGADTAVRLGGIFGMQVVTTFVLSSILPRPKPKFKLPV
ncbi:MAG: hypothetical protein JWM27_583, partial [Gemmatimonadetes bacterium]|nr:hypothetical protein [Gemmatimonadota bacterium]